MNNEMASRPVCLKSTAQEDPSGHERNSGGAGSTPEAMPESRVMVQAARPRKTDAGRSLAMP